MADEPVEPQETTTEEVPWATADSLPTEPFAVVTLPVLKQKVRVRYLGQSDIAAIGYLPEMREFAEMMAEKLLNTQEQDATPDELNERFQSMEKERIRYCMIVVHAFVMGQDGPPIRCAECDLVHGPSLWTRQQADLLEVPDIQAIVNAAERTEALQALVPFSEAPENDTEPSVTTGA